MRRGESGQATVELVGALPLIAAVALAVCQVLGAGLARELADHAAEAGAVASLQDADPAQAARRALPGWARSRVSVSVSGAAVRVRVRPPTLIPGTSGLLTATATATTGSRLAIRHPAAAATR
jgi:hypothetical protein